MEHDECNCSVPGLGGAMQFISTTNFFYEKNVCQLIKKTAGKVKSSVLTK